MFILSKGRVTVSQEEKNVGILSFPVFYICLTEPFRSMSNGGNSSKQTFLSETEEFTVVAETYKFGKDGGFEDVSDNVTFVPMTYNGLCAKFHSEVEYLMKGTHLIFYLVIFLFLSKKSIIIKLGFSRWDHSDITSYQEEFNSFTKEFCNTII